MRKPIFVLVEGGVSKGMGHIVRQFALCQLLKIEKRVVVYLETDWTREEIDKRDLFFKNLYCVKKITDAFNQIPENAVVFMDGYNFDIQTINKLKRLKRLKIIFVADVHKNVPNCDVLINHLPWIKTDEYPKANISKKLLGPKYAILRKPFYSKSKSTHKNRVLICLGGSDVERQVYNIYSELIKSGISPQAIDILYNKPIKDIPNDNLHFNLNAKQVHTLITKSNLCFITPGNISYEVFSIHRAAIMGYVSESQKTIVKQFQKLGLSYNVGEWSKANFKKLRTWIETAQTIQKHQELLFKNLSAQNIINELVLYIK